MSRVNRTWDEIAIGDVGELTRVCTADDIVVFVHASGNYNPAHLAPSPDAIAPSMWVGSLFSAVLGNVLPGPGTNYRSQTLRFYERAESATSSPSGSPSPASKVMGISSPSIVIWSTRGEN